MVAPESRASDSLLDRRLLLMHQAMLSDRRRLEVYDRALAQAITPGAIVADVGAGTLILSLLALRHGAGHVYAIEGDPRVAALAERIAVRNHLHGKLTLIQGDARSVRLPRMADVIVSEMMGNLGPEEEMAEQTKELMATFSRILGIEDLEAGKPHATTGSAMGS